MRRADLVGVTLDTAVFYLDEIFDGSRYSSDDTFAPFFLPFQIGVHPNWIIEEERTSLHSAVESLFLACLTGSSSSRDVWMEKVKQRSHLAVLAQLGWCYAGCRMGTFPVRHEETVEAERDGGIFVLRSLVEVST